MGHAATITLLFLFVISCFTVDASWKKVSGYKFISGSSLGSESTYYGSLASAKPKCQSRCDKLPPCKYFRLYEFVGTVYCTLFKHVTDYSCPVDSMDWHCMFAEGESWMKSN